MAIGAPISLLGEAPNKLTTDVAPRWLGESDFLQEMIVLLLLLFS